MKMKTYHAERGVPIDATFLDHQRNGCEQCKRFDETKPATVALLCLEGAILWKRENGVKVTPEREAKSENIVSKEALRRAMRYK